MMDDLNDVRFRGKTLAELSYQEALEALAQALRHIRQIEPRRSAFVGFGGIQILTDRIAVIGMPPEAPE